MSKQVSSFSIVIFFILFIIIGSLSISLLSIQLSPTKTTPNLTISFSWYNASSRTIESEVTCIIESMLGTIEGITEINSKSSDGVGQINIKLKPNTDIQILRYEVSSLIRQIYPKLPKQVSYPQISFNNPDDIRNLPFLIYTITEIDHTMNIRKYTTDFIIPKLATIDGISKIQISGANEQQWQVAYNHDDLLKYNISIQEIMESIRKYFSNQSLGVAYTKNIINDTLVNSIIIKHIEYDTLHWNIPLKIINNKIVYLTDICKITKSALF